MTGFSELLSSLVTDEKQKSYLEAIKSSGKNLLMLINDILDLSKIEAGKLEIHYSQVDLRILIKEVEQVFALQASKKEITFITDISRELPPALKLDEIRLRQVLLNIVGNAVKFTEKGYISLSVNLFRKENENVFDVHILVEDSGIGIPAEDLATIFESFKQRVDQDSSRYGGTGLGLTICKRLVEMMDGEIQVDSIPGEGSTFKVILNNVAASYEEAPSLSEKFHHGDIQFEKSRVLVVDDVESNRLLLKELLNNVNLDVLEAQNGHEAIVITPEYRPDLVLMDIRMPVMDGFEAARQLKNNKLTRDIPILAITAFSSSMDPDQIVEKGFSGFLAKPVEINRLLSELSKHLPVAHRSNTGGRKMGDEGTVLVDSLSKQSLAKLPDLIGTLETDFLKRWQLFGEKQPMNDVRRFGEELRKLGEEFEVKSIQKYGESLVVHVDNFDINSMQAALDEFPVFLSELKSIMEDNS